MVYRSTSSAPAAAQAAAASASLDIFLSRLARASAVHAIAKCPSFLFSKTSLPPLAPWGYHRFRSRAIGPHRSSRRGVYVAQVVCSACWLLGLCGLSSPRCDSAFLYFPRSSSSSTATLHRLYLLAQNRTLACFGKTQRCTPAASPQTVLFTCQPLSYDFCFSTFSTFPNFSASSAFFSAFFHIFYPSALPLRHPDLHPSCQLPTPFHASPIHPPIHSFPPVVCSLRPRALRSFCPEKNQTSFAFFFKIFPASPSLPPRSSSRTNPEDRCLRSL